MIAVVDGPAVAAGRFADDPEEVARQQAMDPSLDHDNPLSEVYEDQIQAADLVILNKTDLMRRGRSGAGPGDDRQGLAAGGESASRRAKGGWIWIVLLGLRRRPRTIWRRGPRITMPRTACTNTTISRVSLYRLPEIVRRRNTAARSDARGQRGA